VQLLAVARLRQVMPPNHPRRRESEVVIWTLVLTAVAWPLMTEVEARVAPVVPIGEGFAQVFALLLVTTAIGGVNVAVVALCARLARSDLERAHERATLVERVALRQQANADTGQFAVTVAHDLKNVLQATSIVASELRRAPHRREQYWSLSDASESLARKLNRLLEFARFEPSTAALVEVGQFLERLRPILETLLVERTFTISLGDASLLSRIDAEALERMLLEMCEQARLFTPTLGEVSVQLRRETVTSPAPAHDVTRPHVPEGDFVCVCVSDSGAPVDAANLAGLFEPRVSEDEKGRGGLGLAWVRAHAQSVGGDLTVDAGRAKGAAIRLWLPLVRA
jgi:signal transduction histidine kinase